MIRILDGKVIRDNLIIELKNKVSVLPYSPKLVIIQIGNLPESNKYIKNKIKFAEKVGVLTDLRLLSNDITEAEIINLIEELNNDFSVNGIIVQLPLPKHLDTWKIIENIRPDKDVDGLTSKTKFMPATARGVVALLNYYQIPVLNKKVVVMGRSKLVGDPVRKALEAIGCEVLVVHSKTLNPTQITQQADILIVAVGKAKMVNADYIKPNAIIIDIGINFVDNHLLPLIQKHNRPGQQTRLPSEGNGLADHPALTKAGIDGKPSATLVGDVDFDSVKNIASAITPVPGGIGPLTVASLFANLLDACK